MLFTSASKLTFFTKIDLNKSKQCWVTECLVQEEPCCYVRKCFWVYASFSINGMFTFEWKEVMVEIATVVMITVCSDCQHMIAYVCVIWIRNYCPSQDWSSVYTYVCMWGRIQGFWTGTVPIISIFVRTCKMWTYVQNSTLFSTKLISWPSTLKWWSCSVMRVKLQSQCYKPLWLRFCLTLATKVCT